MNRLIPKPLQDIMESKGELKQHGYDTRYKRSLNIHKHTGVQYSQSFLCRSTSEYNKPQGHIPTKNKLRPSVRELKNTY